MKLKSNFTEVKWSITSHYFYKEHIFMHHNAIYAWRKEICQLIEQVIKSDT
jgi:hypothetical protein